MTLSLVAPLNAADLRDSLRHFLMLRPMFCVQVLLPTYTIEEHLVMLRKLHYDMLRDDHLVLMFETVRVDWLARVWESSQ